MEVYCTQITSLLTQSIKLVGLPMSPGVYAVILSVEDNAGNAQVTRRFLMFDDENVVTINSDSDNQLRVESAVEGTDYTWLTSVQDANNACGKVNVQKHETIGLGYSIRGYVVS